jgi:hypothetical protein
MKVVCIVNENNWFALTIDKTYEVIKEVIKFNNVWYLIINDKENKYCFPKEWFKPLSEYRIEKINKLLEE